jgi:hypothetical protein
VRANYALTRRFPLDCARPNGRDARHPRGRGQTRVVEILKTRLTPWSAAGRRESADAAPRKSLGLDPRTHYRVHQHIAASLLGACSRTNAQMPKCARQLRDLLLPSRRSLAHLPDRPAVELRRFTGVFPRPALRNFPAGHINIIYRFIYVCMHLRICMYVYTHTHTRTQTHTHVQTQTHTCILVSNKYMHAYIDTNIHTQVTHTHTHTLMLTQVTCAT